MTSRSLGEPVWEPADTVTHAVGKTEYNDDEERSVAVLWVPDIEQQHGWREYYVKKAPSKPARKRMGYRR